MNGILVTVAGTGMSKTYFVCFWRRYNQHYARQGNASKSVISAWPRSNEEIQHTDTSKLLAADLGKGS